MKKIEPADVHCLNAAEGWLELENHLEADKELDNITSQQMGDITRAESAKYNTPIITSSR